MYKLGLCIRIHYSWNTSLSKDNAALLSQTELKLIRLGHLIHLCINVNFAPYSWHSEHCQHSMSTSVVQLFCHNFITVKQY